MCLNPTTWPGVRVLNPVVTRAAPIYLRLRNFGIQAARLLSNGAPSWTHVNHRVLMERSKARHPPVTTIAVGHDQL